MSRTTYELTVMDIISYLFKISVNTVSWVESNVTVDENSGYILVNLTRTLGNDGEDPNITQQSVLVTTTNSKLQHFILQTCHNLCCCTNMRVALGTYGNTLYNIRLHDVEHVTILHFHSQTNLFCSHCILTS